MKEKNPASELAKKRWNKVSKKDRIDEMKRIRSFGKQKTLSTDNNLRTSKRNNILNK
jgi:hypothetical protein